MNVLEQLEQAAAEEETEDPRYIFVEKLGEGGMGKVWLAQKRIPNGELLPVVIKTPTLPNEKTEPEAFRKRAAMFLQEMAVSAQLRHPNIVRVTDWGTSLFGSEHFFEMELIEGISLLELLARRTTAVHENDPKWGALQPEDVAWIGMQACKGLHYAHNHRRTGEDDVESGVLHRDISPDNIMVSDTGEVKITDWGITKALDKHGDASRTGTIYGKVKYMPPEQAQGHSLDPRADVYALGITLVAALTGRDVFPTDDSDYFTVLARICGGQRPTVAELAPDAPPVLQHLLEGMIQRDRELRPRTAGELVERFNDIAIAVGGNLLRVEQGFAERVKQAYVKGKRTKRAIQAAHQNVPSKSTSRPISAATQPDPEASAPPEIEPTERFPGPARPVVDAPHEQPESSERPKLVLAFGVSLIVLLALVAGIVGFMVAGGGSTAQPAPEPVAEPAPARPALPPTPEPSATAAVAEAPATADPGEAALPEAEVDNEAETEPPSPAERQRRVRVRPPPPEPRPLAPTPSPAPQQRATSRTPGLSDLLGN